MNQEKLKVKLLERCTEFSWYVQIIGETKLENYVIGDVLVIHSADLRDATMDGHLEGGLFLEVVPRSYLKVISRRPPVSFSKLVAQRVAEKFSWLTLTEGLIWFTAVIVVIVLVNMWLGKIPGW